MQIAANLAQRIPTWNLSKTVPYSLPCSPPSSDLDYAHHFDVLRVIHFTFTSWSPGVCELDGEAIFIELWRICGDQTGKTLAGRVDHEQIAIRTIIPAQPNVGTRALIVSSVHLQQRGERQKSGKRIIRLEAAKYDREIP